MPFKIVGVNENSEFPERVEIRLEDLFGDAANSTRVEDIESLTRQSLDKLYDTVITPKRFGAVGDGVTDDTAAWNAWKAATGLKGVTPGSYLVDGVVLEFDSGQLGGGINETRLTPTQQAMVGTRPENIRTDQAKLFISSEHEDSDIMPALYVISLITDDSGDAFATKSAGIHSYVEQTGGDTNQYVKAINGVAVNAAAGNNDNTAVVGYAYKLPVEGGVGDSCGSGGASWQYSTEEGLALGGEFAVHQNVAGTSSSPNATNGNNSMSMHLTSNSVGDRAWSALGIDAQSAATAGSNRHGYWNVISIGRSCFARNGENEEGTVGINFGNNTTNYPEKAFYLGNAVYHFWRNNAATRMRTSSLDIDNGSGAVGIRLITPAGNPQSRYIGGYLGSSGPDGESNVTTHGTLNFPSNGYVGLSAHDTSGNEVSRIELSPSSPALLPPSVGTMNLGASSRRWNQVYAVNGTIQTSDEREKLDISDIPDAALDAWGEVGFKQFRMRDAVNAKGTEARIHSGLVAQKVMQVFEAHGLDAAAYGLLCYDEWEELPEVVETQKVLMKHAVYEEVLVKDAVYDDNGNEIKAAVYEDGELISPEVWDEITTVTPGIPAGNRYGIRYEEALCFEAAYQRRRSDKLEERMSRLEALLEDK